MKKAKTSAWGEPANQLPFRLAACFAVVFVFGRRGRRFKRTLLHKTVS